MVFFGACTNSDGDRNAGANEGDVDFGLVVARAQRSMIIAGRAAQVLIEPCMEKKGFSYPTFTQIPDPVDPAQFGLVPDFTSSIAEVEGYNLYVSSISESGPEIEDLPSNIKDFHDRMSDEEKALFNEALLGQGDSESIEFEFGDGGSGGISIGGCNGQAKMEFFGDKLLEIHQVFNSLQFSRLPHSADSRIAEIEFEWSKCMKQLGHNYLMVYDAIDHGLELRGSSLLPSETEKAIAVDDAKCRDETTYTESKNNRISELDSTISPNQEELILTWSVLEEFILARSSEILGVDLTANP